MVALLLPPIIRNENKIRHGLKAMLRLRFMLRNRWLLVAFITYFFISSGAVWAADSADVKAGQVGLLRVIYLFTVVPNLPEFLGLTSCKQ